MGQFEIIDFLKKNRGSFFSARVINQKFNISKSSKSYHKVRRFASFYGVKVKTKRGSNGTPYFLIGYSKR